MPMTGVVYAYKGYKICQEYVGQFVSDAPAFRSAILTLDGEKVATCCQDRHQWGSYSDVCAERHIDQMNSEEETAAESKTSQGSEWERFRKAFGG